jgi:hypothetical protein
MVNHITSPLPPFYRIIQDPCEERSTLYFDLKDKLYGQQYAHMEKLVHEQKLWGYDSGVKVGTNKTRKEKADNEDTGLPVDPQDGGLVRRLIQAKNNEINRLKESLYEKTVTFQRDQEMIIKLRHALKKSLKYYSNAESWQHHGTLALQQDVLHLKAELSSLLAFLINSEQEKMEVRML